MTQPSRLSFGTLLELTGGDLLVGGGFDALWHVCQVIDGIIACALSVAGVLGVLTGGLGLPRSAADGLAVGVKQAERDRTGEQTDTRVAVDV